MSERSIFRSLAIGCLTALALSATSAQADPENEERQPAAATTASEAGPSIQLNKLESVEKGCRAYLVIDNETNKTYQSFKVDLVLFQTDGVIGRRFSIELAPLKPKKKTVKLFEIDNVACDTIGSFLVNDVMECKADTGPIDNCLQSLTTSSLSKVQLSK